MSFETERVFMEKNSSGEKVKMMYFIAINNVFLGNINNGRLKQCVTGYILEL